MDVVNSLDSPGTSSGYCSGTEEEMAFTVSLFESGLPAGCADIFPAGESLSSCFDASGLDRACPERLDTLMTLNATTSGDSNSAVPMENIEMRDSEDRNFRELRDSWIFEMLFGNHPSTSVEFNRYGDYHAYDFDIDAIDFDAQLLSATLPEKAEGTEETLPTTPCRSDPFEGLELTKKSVGQGGSNEPLSPATDEGDWNVLMSFSDWGEIGGDETLLAGDDFSLRDIWKDSARASFEYPAERINCQDKDSPDDATLVAVSPDRPGFDALEMSSEEAIRMTGSDATSNHIANKQRDVTSPESTRCLGDSSWTTARCPSSFRAEAAQRKLSTESLPSGQSSRTTNYFRPQSSPQILDSEQRRTSPTAPPATQSTAYHTLEDHRYSSRRSDQVVSPVATNSLPKVDKSSKCSVLETLLRTSVRFNPNHGSSVIFSKESSRKRTPSSSSILQTTKHSIPSNPQTVKRHHHQNSTLLHRLLTCRMEEVEKKRGGIGRREQRGPRKDHLDGKNCLVVGLIPSDDPVVDCSFLYDEDQDLNAEDHNINSGMSLMDTVAIADDIQGSHSAQYTSDDESDTWFVNYFNQSS